MSNPNIVRKLLMMVVSAAIALGFFAVAYRRFTDRRPSTAALVTPVVPAPDLNLTDLSGKTFNIAKLKGSVAVVNFWAAWCTPCAEEIPQFVSLQQRYRDQGLQVVGISMDDADAELREFYRHHQMNYPVIAGNQNVAQAFGGVLGLPTTLVISRQGRIEKKFTGTTDFATLERQVVGLLMRQ